MTGVQENSLGYRLAKRAEVLSSERGIWDTFWQELGNYCSPRKAEITEIDYNPGTEGYNQLYDNTAIQANMILANGQMSLLTPPNENWMSFTAPFGAGQPGVERWYAQVTEITLKILSHSNFYEQIHELYLDRGAFGTGCISCEEGRNKPLIFKTFPVGSFSICEDEEGYVDTVFREFRMTLRQMVDKFGLESLSAQLQERWRSGDPRAEDDKADIIHAVYPRKDRNEESPYAWDMPIASCYVEKKTKHVLSESGYHELPFAVTRFLRWRDEKYGWAPSWIALPEARQLNYLEKHLDALVEIQAFPRLLVPSNLSGEIDLRPAGVTVFDPNNPNAIPREWGNMGRYDMGVDRSNHRREAINKAFHVDLFQLFANLEQKNMTAREVAERASEKLFMFNPTFSRMTAELFNPLLKRVFAVLLRGGYYPQPPMGLLMEGPGGYVMPDPEMQYNSRIALAIRALENGSILQTMDMFLPFAELRPEVWDNLDADAAFRDAARNAGMPSRWLRDARETAELRQQRADAEAQAVQAQQAEQYAKAARNASGADPDKLQQLLGQ